MPADPARNPLPVLPLLRLPLMLVAIFGLGSCRTIRSSSNVSQALMAPSAAHIAGTDQLGRDVFSRIIVPHGSISPSPSRRSEYPLPSAPSSARSAVIPVAGSIAAWPLRRRADGFSAFRVGNGDGRGTRQSGREHHHRDRHHQSAVLHPLCAAEVNVRRNVGWVEAARAAATATSRSCCASAANVLRPWRCKYRSSRLGDPQCCRTFLYRPWRQPPTPNGDHGAEGARFISTENGGWSPFQAWR